MYYIPLFIVDSSWFKVYFIVVLFQNWYNSLQIFVFCSEVVEITFFVYVHIEKSYQQIYNDIQIYLSTDMIFGELSKDIQKKAIFLFLYLDWTLTFTMC